LFILLFYCLVYQILNSQLISKEINKIISAKQSRNKNIIMKIDEIIKEVKALRDDKFSYLKKINDNNKMSFTIDESCFLLPIFEVIYYI